MYLKSDTDLSYLPPRFQHKLSSDLSYLLKYNINSLEQIILFGSCARGEMRLTSDLDLLIITSTPLSRMEKGEIHSVLEEPIDEVHTDIVFYTHEQFQSSNRLIVQQIKKEGVLLYEK